MSTVQEPKLKNCQQTSINIPKNKSFRCMTPQIIGVFILVVIVAIAYRLNKKIKNLEKHNASLKQELKSISQNMMAVDRKEEDSSLPQQAQKQSQLHSDHN